GHFVMAPLAAASGAIVFASQTGTVRQVDPGLTVVMSLLVGAGTAVAVHATRATVRPVSNLVLMGPVVSVAEDLGAAFLTFPALLMPFRVPVIAVAAALAVWLVLRQRSRRRAAQTAYWYGPGGPYGMRR